MTNYVRELLVCLESAFLRILEVSIVMGIVLLFLMAVRFLLKKQPKSLSYGLWGIAGVSLLYASLPSLQAPVKSLLAGVLTPGVGTAPGNLEDTAADMRNGAVSQLADGAASPAWNGGVGDNFFSHVATVTNGNAVLNRNMASPDGFFAGNFSVLTVLSVIWAVGAACFLIFSIVSWLRLRKRLRFAVKTEERVYESHEIDVPFVYGLFSPRVYLPAGIGANERELILAHEMCHIQRRDYLVLLAVRAVLILFWFHPLFWIGSVLLQRDMEMSCDEKATKDFDRKRVADYSSVLMNFGRERVFLSGASFGGRDSVVKRRVLNLFNRRKRRPVLSAIAIIVCLTVSAAAITACSPAGSSDSAGSAAEGAEDAAYRHWYDWFRPALMGNMEEENANALLSKMGTVLGQEQTVDGVTVKLDAAVREGNDMLFSFSVSKDADFKASGASGKNSDCFVESVMTKEAFLESFQANPDTANLTEAQAEELWKDESRRRYWGDILGDVNDDSRFVLKGYTAPKDCTQFKIHLENITGLDGTFDFEVTVPAEPADDVAAAYLVNRALTDADGRDYFINRIKIYPLGGAEMELYSVDPLDDSMLTDRIQKIGFNGMRYKGSVLSGTQKFGYLIGESSNDLKVGVDDIPYVFEPDQVEAIEVGGKWIELSDLVRVDGTWDRAASPADGAEQSVKLPEDLTKMALKSNGKLYYATGETGAMGDAGSIAGYIQSSVDSSKTPDKNGQSNFGGEGNPYTYDGGDGIIMVYINEDYYVFMTEE